MGSKIDRHKRRMMENLTRSVVQSQMALAHIHARLRALEHAMQTRDPSLTEELGKLFEVYLTGEDQTTPEVKEEEVSNGST